MIDHYKILTLSFSDAHLDELIDYVIPSTDKTDESIRLLSLKQEMEVDELYYLNTCNRVVYLFYSNKPISQLEERLISFLRGQNINAKTGLTFNHYSGEDAIRHFFEVAASLKSMVVGEQEILRQVKEAYDRCWHEGLSGDQIRILFQCALQTAKTIHQQTRISEKTISVVSLAMKKLRRLGINPGDEVIMIGAGETMQKVAKFLREWKMEKIKVFNRSENNLELIRQILPQANTFLFDELKDHNLDVPYIISCTGYGGFVLTPDIIEHSTRGKGLINCRGILDLAVPRDVHPDIITTYGLQVIEVESLRTVAEKNKAFRVKEVSKASKIISEEILAFREKVHRRFIEKAFQEIPAQVYATRDKALNEVYKARIEGLDAESQELIREIMGYMARKCISIPMKTARKQYTAIRKDMQRTEPDREENLHS